MLKKSPTTVQASILLLSFCLLLLLAPAATLAEGIQITPFLGYRIGGDFEDGATGSELSLSEEETYGIILNKEGAPGFQSEFFYSFQPSRLTAGGVVTPGVLTDIDVEYFHLGGKQYWDRGAARTFVVASAGATHFSPHAAGLESDTRFSVGLGGGVELGGEGRIGFRLEGRGFATFFNDESAIFCGSSGGCAIFAEGNLLLQFEALAGVTFKF
jgi:hypothetical protein